MNTQEKNMLVLRYANGREDRLIERYILDGPAQIREELGLTEEQWKVIFDYLVFNHNLLYKTVTQASEFFIDVYIEHGLNHVRDILDVNDPKYDVAFEVVFDFLAISHEGLYYHVLQNRDRYLMAFKARGGDFVRKVLGIWKAKYTENWERILEMFFKTVCDGLFSDQTFEHGLRGFCALINAMREHRPVSKSEMFRPGLV